MTAVPKNPRVSELRELFRHLHAFRAVFEDHGLEDITTPDGNTWSIWDLEYLYAQLPRLRPRQQQAITLCLIHNMRERDAAIAMGVSETNPVMMYATLGLQRLLDMVDAGELARYRECELPSTTLRTKHAQAMSRLAEQTRAVVQRVSTGCWIYPNPGSGPPRILLRSAAFPSGFLHVDPLELLFQLEIGPLPHGTRLSHTQRIPPFSRSCVNPYHHVDAVFPQSHQRRMQELAEAYETAKKKRYEELLADYLEKL